MATPDQSTLTVYVASPDASLPPGVITNPMLVFKDSSGFTAAAGVGYAVEDASRFTMAKDSSLQQLHTDLTSGTLATKKATYPITAVSAATCGGTPGTPVQVIAADTTRKVLHIFNRSNGAEIVDLGVDNTVTQNGGIPLYAGGGFTFEGQGATNAVWAVSPVASTPLSWARG